MFKKYHVSVFIKNIMEAKGIKKADIYNAVAISRQNLENILEKESDISYDTAIKLAIILNVKASLLMNLNLIYINFKHPLEAKKMFEADVRRLKINLEKFNIKTLNFSDFYNFTLNKNYYMNEKNIFHYKPNDANNTKEWLFVNQQNNSKKLKNWFDINKFRNYLFGSFIKKINLINTTENFTIFMKNLKNDLNNLGVDLKIVETKLKTTIKAITLIKEMPKIIIEFEEDAPNLIWKITHEFMHIIYHFENNRIIEYKTYDQESVKEIENKINNMVSQFLLSDYYSFYDISQELIDPIIKKLEIKYFQSLIFKNYWGFMNGKHTVFKKQLKGEKNDILQLFI